MVQITRLIMLHYYVTVGKLGPDYLCTDSCKLIKALYFSMAITESYKIEIIGLRSIC